MPDEYALLIDEAEDRLKTDIADDVEDVVEQLIDEGLCVSTEVGALKHDLKHRGWS